MNLKPSSHRYLAIFLLGFVLTQIAINLGIFSYPQVSSAYRQGVLDTQCQQQCHPQAYLRQGTSCACLNQGKPVQIPAH